MIARTISFVVLAGSLAAAARWGGADAGVGSLQKTPAPDFTTRILPILTRVGCNSGNCHGAAGGQGGFSLSLRGYDAAADYDAIVRERAGRRVDLSIPEHSLILRKPSREFPHRGGRKLPVDSKYYEEVRAWIAAGAPWDASPAKAPVALAAEPADWMGKSGEKQQLKVILTLADRTTRDVSDVVLFTSNDESVARVSVDGEVEIAGSGETAIFIKFPGLVAAARVGAKYHEIPLTSRPNFAPSPDGRIAQKLWEMGLPSAPPCDDATFLRRASLDLAGVLPTPEKARAFIKDTNPAKREMLVDELLDSPGAVTRWTRWLADLCRLREETMGVDGARRLQDYLHSQIAARTPLDKVVRELVTAVGEPWSEGPAAFALATEFPSAQMEFITKTFAGTRLQCAQCHQHPFDRWSREDYYGLAAFFSRVRRENGKIILADSGEFTDPKSGQYARPRLPGLTGGDAAVFPTLQKDGDRRAVFCDWLLDRESMRFDRMMVNRVWKELTGVGIIDPVDDVRDANPPSNPELLNSLSLQFRDGGRDLFQFIRSVAKNDYYGASTMPPAGAERDKRYYSHATLRAMPGPMLLDAVSAATGSVLSLGARGKLQNAQALPDEDGSNYSIRALGRCPRDGSADPSVPQAPTVAGALHWLHGSPASELLSPPNGRVSLILQNNSSVDEAIDELFLSTLTRFPREDERVKAAALFDGKMTKEGLEDLLWALMATTEFATIH